MMAWLLRIVMFSAVSGAFVWMVLSAPDRPTAVMFQFNIFVPMLLILGVAGLVRAFHQARLFGWYRYDAEGLAAFSFLALALGLDTGWSLIRRAADTAGYDPRWMLHSDYRMASGAMVILAIFLVLRWATRREFEKVWPWPRMLPRGVPGELPWATLAICMIGFAVYQTDSITRILVWVYEMIV